MSEVAVRCDWVGEGQVDMARRTTSGAAMLFVLAMKVQPIWRDIYRLTGHYGGIYQ